MTIFCSYLFSFLKGGIFFPSIQTYDYLIIGASISILSSSGDLIESFLKRAANLKDSGNLFPGHGGMLDRVFYIKKMDALAFSAPVIYIYFTLFYT